MTEQLSLMSLPAVGAHRRADPRTSTEAAASCSASSQRDVLLRELRATTVGRTADELEWSTGIPRYVIASRPAQMRRDGLVEPFGLRANQHGRQVQVWWPISQARSAVDVHVTGGRL